MLCVYFTFPLYKEIASGEFCFKKKNQLENGITDLKRKWVDKHFKILDYLIVSHCRRTSSFHWWEKEGLANNLFNTRNPEFLSFPSMLFSWIEERILKFHNPLILHLLPQTWSVFRSNYPRWHWCTGIFHQPDRIPVTPANYMLFTCGLLEGTKKLVSPWWYPPVVWGRSPISHEREAHHC